MWHRRRDRSARLTLGLRRRQQQFLGSLNESKSFPAIRMTNQHLREWRRLGFRIQLLARGLNPEFELRIFQQSLYVTEGNRLAATPDDFRWLLFRRFFLVERCDQIHAAIGAAEEAFAVFSFAERAKHAKTRRGAACWAPTP